MFGIGTLLGQTIKLVTLPVVVVAATAVKVVASETQDLVKELKK